MSFLFLNKKRFFLLVTLSFSFIIVIGLSIYSGLSRGKVAGDFSIATAGGVIYDKLEMDEVDLANEYGQWLYTESNKYISLNFVEKYDQSLITDLTKYSITSANDSNYSNSKKPISLSYRWRVIHAPRTPVDLKIAHRIFLELPNNLKNGMTYTINVGNIGIDTEPFVFTFNDDNLNQNIKVNQVGYLLNNKKIAYVGQYMGNDASGHKPMIADVSVFQIKDAKTGNIAFTGSGTLSKENDIYSGQNVYELDFTNFNSVGNYVVKVPGIGVSFPFRIGNDVYNEVFGEVLRGAYNQRCGTELVYNYTRHVHEEGHTQDGRVINHDPMEAWFIKKFGDKNYYPTSLSGQTINTQKGHHDAGDYGKYTVNGAFVVSNILTAYDVFPEKLMSDYSNIPERGNGIPDVLDELKWELDWLENMQDPNDGGVFCIVKPDGNIEYYENRLPDDPKNSQRQIYAKDTVCTASYAAALAKAASSDIMNQYYPNDIARYLQKAKKAWEFLENNSGALCWHHYGCLEQTDDLSLHERVWAAVELYGATGEEKYQDFFLDNYDPSYKRWGWWALFEASGQSTYTCALMDDSSFDQATKDICRGVIKSAADGFLTESNRNPYKVAVSRAVLDFYTPMGWEFLQDKIYPLVIAGTMFNNSDYINAALANWDYILGTNPLGYSYITGVGSKRFRSPLNNVSDFDDIKEPVSGLPIGLCDSLPWNGQYSSLGDSYPKGDKNTYPKLMGQWDGMNVGAEFTIPTISQNLVIASFFANSSVSSNNAPVINSLVADKYYGTAPLAVNFNLNASDSDGSIANYYWDFDDGSFSFNEDPSHIFDEPFKIKKVVTTITDNYGAETIRETIIKTRPETFLSSSYPYSVDENTIALFHFDNSFKDVDNKYSFVLSGSTNLDNNNLLWMENMNGSAVRFNSYRDNIKLELPRATIWPDENTVLTMDAKIYIDKYDAYSNDVANIFSLLQNNVTRSFRFYEDKWSGKRVTVQNYWGNLSTLMDNAKIDEFIKTETWYDLKFIVENGKSKVLIDDIIVAEAQISPSFENSTSPIVLTVGGFKGWIDELRISNISRIGSNNCTSNWSCSDWSVCSSSGTQTRICSDLNNCGLDADKPIEVQTCSYENPNINTNINTNTNTNTNPDTNTNTNTNPDINTNTNTNSGSGIDINESSENHDISYGDIVDPVLSFIAKTSYSGRLVRTISDPAVYYLADDNKKRLFVNEVTFWSHYNGNWSDIKVSGKKVGVDKVSQDEFDNIDIAENITVKPASRLVRFQNSSKVYIVFGNGNLKYITDAEALKLFGSNWENGLIIIQNGFEIDYSKDNERFVDTDGDGVSDDDEIYFYKTDPNNPDTDGDGYSDGVELLNGYDPNGPGKL